MDEVDRLSAELDAEPEENAADIPAVEPTETETDTAEDDDEPIFNERELQELIDGHKPEEPLEEEPFEYHKLESLARLPDAEIAARVKAPQSEAEYTRATDEYDLRLEILGDRRRATSTHTPLQRRQLDREFLSLSAERAAYTTAYDVQAEQRAMVAYESSPLGVEEKAAIARGVAAAQERVQRMAEEAEQKRMAAAKRQAKDLRRFYGAPQ